MSEDINFVQNKLARMRRFSASSRAPPPPNGAEEADRENAELKKKLSDTKTQMVRWGRKHMFCAKFATAFFSWKTIFFQRKQNKENEKGTPLERLTHENVALRQNLEKARRIDRGNLALHNHVFPRLIQEVRDENQELCDENQELCDENKQLKESIYRHKQGLKFVFNLFTSFKPDVEIEIPGVDFKDGVVLDSSWLDYARFEEDWAFDSWVYE